MSIKIAKGTAPSKIAQRITDIANTLDNSYRAAEFYDDTVLTVANMYSERKDFVNAAAMISKIDSTGRWIAAAQKYSECGGELGLVMANEAMREITNYEGAREFLPEYGPVQPQARREVADFLQKMKDRDYAGAEEVIIAMAQKLGSNDVEALRGYHFPAFVQRLLTEQPGSVEIGLQVATDIKNSTFGYHQQIHEMFIAAGNQEVEAVSWDRIQPGYHGRVMYLLQYAGVVLAAAQGRN